MGADHFKNLARVVLLTMMVILAKPVLAQPIIVNVGTTNNFVAPPGAAGYVWALDCGVTTNTGSVFSYSPAVNSVGTHWLSVAMTQTNGMLSNQNWQFRVDIVLPASGMNYYVATTGADANAGTLAAPFLTLERARNAIRTNGVPAGGVTVWIRGGAYQRTNTFALTNPDSGFTGSPVVYCAYPGETPVFTTGTAINSNSFSTLDSSLWPRVMPGVTASNILQLDLNALGIVNKGPFPTSYGACPILNPYQPSTDGGLCELFFNGQRQLISRYPNNNPTNRWLTPYMKMNGVISKTATNYLGTNYGGMFYFNAGDNSHIQRWLTAAAESNLWVQGLWRVPWESEGLRVQLIDTNDNFIATAAGATPGSTGFGDKYSAAAGSYNEPYWALNLLEEIDQPGEWSIDFVRKKLYFLPPGQVTNGAVVISDFGKPVFQITGSSNVVFSGLTFDTSLAQGILITNGLNNLVLNCTFRNLGSYAVDLSEGKTNGVVDCDLSLLAAGGVFLRGGSETTPRVPTGNFVVNNDIHDFSQVVPIYAAGVDAGFGGMSGGGGGGGHVVCVGARIAHNHIKGSPHCAIVRGSYDKIFEYNSIEEYCTISGDFGGIYSYITTNQGSFDTLRFNYLSCPTNYLFPTYLNPGPAGGIGIQVDGAWVGEQIYGNLTANDVRGSYGEGGEGGAGSEFYDNLQVNCGPTIPMEWEGSPSVFATNVAALGNITISGQQTGPNFSYATDPGFINWTNQDFRINPDSVVYADQPGFREIPVEMIGLYNDEYRTNAVSLPPVISNVTGVTGLTTNSATLNGELIFPWLTPDTTVRVFWGTNDGGTNGANWSNSINLGIRTRALLSTNISGLLPSTTYFYRYQASNSAAVVWATNTVTFVVPNAPPALAVISDQYLNPGQWLILTNKATDAASPPLILTFSLLTAPSNATIGAASGVLSWRVPVAAANSVQPLAVTVADNGSPSLSATQSFDAYIGSVVAPHLSQAVWNNGVFGVLINGDVGPDYIIQASTNLTVWNNLFTNTPMVTPFLWTDWTATNFSSRFYRVLLGP